VNGLGGGYQSQGTSQRIVGFSSRNGFQAIARSLTGRSPSRSPSAVFITGLLMKPRISIITIGVDDLERALRFYRDGLGFPTRGSVGTEYEHGAVAFFDLANGQKLAIWSRTDMAHEAKVPLGPRSAAEFALGHLVPSKAGVAVSQRSPSGSWNEPVYPPQNASWGGSVTTAPACLAWSMRAFPRWIPATNPSPRTFVWTDGHPGRRKPDERCGVDFFGAPVRHWQIVTTSRWRRR
jgi:catechol 2,3-dioxygenase-like lactoylglutathione lyase family enzyme